MNKMTQKRINKYFIADLGILYIQHQMIEFLFDMKKPNHIQMEN